MKKILRYSILLFGVSCLLSESKAQKVIDFSSNQATKNPKLKLGLAKAIAAFEAKLDFNEATIPNYSLFSFKGNNETILVDIIVNDLAFRKEIMASGGAIVAESEKRITCWISLGKVTNLSKNSRVVWIQPVLKPIHNSGPVQSQGDSAQRSNIARQLTGLNGAGVKIGVLSDSYNNLNGATAGVNAGELPGVGNPNGFTTPVTILSDLGFGGSDEGRAMLEIIHDVAPGAELYFYTAFQSEADFANGIRALADAGCKVIVDDIIYFAEPYFQDGMVAQAVEYAVNVKGATYFSSAGNQFHYGYDAPFQPSTYQPFGNGAIAHNFGTVANPVYFLPVTAGSRGLLMGFQWDEPFLSAGNSSPGSASDLDFFILTTTDNITYTVEASGVDYNLGQDPVEIVSTSSTGVKYLLITKFSGTNPTRVKFTDYARLAWTNTPATIVGIKASTINGHANARGAIAVGAASYDKTPAYGTNPPLLEPFSSRGGTPVLFTTSGVRLAAPEDRLKPEIVAPDRANTSFFSAGYDYEPDGIPNFAGTSASAPHVAAVGALMLQGNPSLTATGIKNALIASCVDMDDPTTTGFDVGFDYASGAGFIKADVAVLSTRNLNCPPAIVTTTRPSVFCEGDSAILDANSTVGYSFQWLRNGANIAGATQARLIAKTTGAYSVKVTNIDCTISSQDVNISAKFGVLPPTTTSRTTTFGTPLTPGNGLQANAICPTQQTVIYAGPTIGYDGGTKSGADPTAIISNLSGNIKSVKISITWRKRNGGTINDCGTVGGGSNPYNNEVSFKIKSPDNTTINLLNAGTYSIGTRSSGVVTTVFDDAGSSIGTIPATGTFKPAQSLGAFFNKNLNGNWTLLANDNGTLDPLCVESFSVVIFTDASNGASEITWWDARSGGNQLGTGSEFFPTESTVGTYTYFAEASCVGSGLPCPVSVRKSASLSITECPSVALDYVQAGNPFTYKFRLVNNIVLAQVPYETSILVKPVCQLAPIESFRMELQGPPPFENHSTIESIDFYSLFNNTGASVLGRNLPIGNYAVTITGYSQDNALGAILYGPITTNFSIVANSASISSPTFTKNFLCTGSSFDVNFTTNGTFSINNQFQVQLSDNNGTFENPVIIGTSTTAGTVACTIPAGIDEGSNYKIRVVSSNQVLEGNVNATAFSLGKINLALASPNDDISSGSTTIKVGRSITANNKILAPATVNYQAGGAILLNAGFQANASSVFKAEIKNCEN